MTYEDVARELRKNIQILSNTFERANLQVLNIGCKPYSDTDPDAIFYVELSSLSGLNIPSTVEVKINLYNSDGEIICMSSEYLYGEEFSGYDTLSITFPNTNALDIAVSGRLYAVLH